MTISIRMICKSFTINEDNFRTARFLPEEYEVDDTSPAAYGGTPLEIIMTDGSQPFVVGQTYAFTVDP